MKTETISKTPTGFNHPAQGWSAATTLGPVAAPAPISGEAGRAPRAYQDKPKKIIVPLAEGIAWGENPEYIYQEKLDGRFALGVVEMKNQPPCALLAGELVVDPNLPRGEIFHAFDCLEFLGADIRNLPLSERLHALDRVFTSALFILPSTFTYVRSERDGGKMLREVLARGGEGVVRKALAGKWGEPMEACKRLETFTCVVTGMNAGQSVQIARIPSPTSELSVEGSMLNVSPPTPCGSVSLFGGKCNQVRIGSILKVEGFGLTRAGQIREPRPCKDTPTSWLIQY